jgi:competence protein ComEA
MRSSQFFILEKRKQNYDCTVARSWIAACRFRWMLSASLRLCGGFAVVVWLTLFALSSTNVYAQLPEGPGRAETERLCKGCHELERSVSRRQDREGWQVTINKMVAFGTKGTDEEFALILDYLTKHYPAGEVPPVNVNTAAAIEMESRLSLKRSQAAAIIAYRTKNGKFKTIDDLKKVPGVDAAKIEAKKDRIVF